MYYLDILYVCVSVSATRAITCFQEFIQFRQRVTRQAIVIHCITLSEHNVRLTSVTIRLTCMEGMHYIKQNIHAKHNAARS